MKRLRKVAGWMLAVALVLGILPPVKVLANDYFTEEPLMTGVRYSGHVNSSTDKDIYLLHMPADMDLSMRIHKGGYLTVTVMDLQYNSVKARGQLERDKTHYFNLPEGDYYLEIKDWWGAGNSTDYEVEFFYHLSTPELTVVSEKSGSMTVKAPASSSDYKPDGYEIRYRLAGKKWTTKKVESHLSLNETIKNLTKGKVYTVQVRRYVEDDNNKKYYSEWSKKSKVTIKK